MGEELGCWVPFTHIFRIWVWSLCSGLTGFRAQGLGFRVSSLRFRGQAGFRA
jgi:hypothetical protein